MPFSSLHILRRSSSFDVMPCSCVSGLEVMIFRNLWINNWLEYTSNLNSMTQEALSSLMFLCFHEEEKLMERGISSM